MAASLDRYRVLAVVGSGAFGKLLHVIDPTSGEPRALKIVPPGPHEAMLLDEFEQLSRLRHPSLPTVFEVGRTRDRIEGMEAGAPFFLAAWIAGVRSDQLAWPTLPGPELGAAVWSYLADIADALAMVHAAGLVHADVAPQNILVDVGGTGRAVLVDLGLAGVVGSAAARGTPLYMAPEALAGRSEPRSDLYGLGVTTLRAITGRAPFDGTTLGEVAHAIIAGPPPSVRAAAPQLPAPLADLLQRLIARDVTSRPPSALAVLDELDQLAAAIAPGSPRRARPNVGAPPAGASWSGGAAVVAAIASQLELGPRPIVVAGALGAGGRTIVDAALARWQLARVARQQPASIRSAGLDELAVLLGVAASPADRSPRSWLERLARAARTPSPSVDALVVDAVDDPRASDFVAALARAAGTRPVIALVDQPPVPRLELAVHLAPLLDAPGIGELATQMLGARTAAPAAWIAGLLVASGGQPLTAIELLRSIASERDPFAIDWAARTSISATELRARQLKLVGPGARRLAAAIVAWGGRVRIDRVLAQLRAEAAKVAIGLADLADLERVGLAHRVGSEVVIDHASSEAIAAQLGTELLSFLAAGGLAAAAGDPQALAELLRRAPLDATRATLATDAAEQQLLRGRADRALALARRAIAIAPARAAMIAARAASALGAYKDAAGYARDAEAAGADPIAAQLVAARAAQRASELATAEAILQRLHAAHPTHAEVAGTYARLLVTRSRYADARTVAASAGDDLTGLRAEAAGLAAFYLGELDAADAAFAALELGGTASNDAATVGRAASLRGMVAQQRGQLGVASERYRDAARRLAEVGEIHAAATAELNLGTVLAERGRASESLPRLAAAGRVFAELGALTELCAAELNRGNSLIAVGQLDEARRAAESALARSDGAPHLRAFALIVLGDARQRLGDTGGAARSYREALAIATERGDAHAQLSAYVALAEAGHRDAQAVDVPALCASDDDRDRWTIARSKLALLDGDEHAWLELASACIDVGERANAADRLERSFRASAVASALASRAGDRVLAQRAAEQARVTQRALVGAAAPAFRVALGADPDLALLADARPPAEPPVRAPPMHLRRLLTLSRRLNTEASVERILDDVIDTAIELTEAERGFLLLRQPAGELAAVVSRNFAASDLAVSGDTVSRSIAERAAQTGEPVMTVDAGIDERFGAAASVAALRLRSVLAVPLRQRGTVIGCIYVDHRLRGGAFDDGAASVLGELADIAAIAIENARLSAELRATTTSIADLNGRLSADLADRDAELARVRADLPDRDRLRHRYDTIIGRSPAMMRTLELVDRAAATALPVVVVGESGTGKELVARALHDHSPRKAGPFVAINCSAVPEPLLESELFGHVRGSFTGADRDRRGLFEVADGGTLFLDEIADTSAAMQAKLLRVLQDGMIRRVGDTTTRKVDVRIVAASQRPLAELVTQGRFREDLRFRLEVIQVAVPALRERDGDVPLLVEHMLARLVPGKPPRLTRAALRALAQHRWPGNVRELENALARGAAMGGDVIDIGDLPDAFATAAARPEPTKPIVGDDLRLKPALTSTEQAYIGAAMARSKGNQTVAAKLLGLSRFGLQKKLRRLAGADDDADEA